MINKQNQKLQAKLVEFKDEIAEKKRQIAELQEMPNQAEFEGSLSLLCRSQGIVLCVIESSSFRILLVFLN